MSDTVIKFGGGQCSATSCGSKNPVAAMMAMAMLTQDNSLSVAHAQEAGVQAVGVTIGGIVVSR